MKILLLVLLIISCSPAYAQWESAYGARADDPLWVQRMYEEDADIGEILDLFERYYAERPFEKSTHTQYLKRWIKDVMRDVDGRFSSKISESERRRMQRLRQSNMLHLPGHMQRSTQSDWTSLGPYDWDHDAASRSYAPGAAHVYTVEQAPGNPDILYAGTANAGVWKTTDHGLNWSPLNKFMDVGRVYAIEIDPTDANVVYAELFSSIYKSADGGTTWNPTGDAVFQGISMQVKDIRINLNNNIEVIAATSDGLFISENGGTDWIKRIDGSFQEIEYHPTNDSIIYAVEVAGDQTRFHRSLDGGQTFSVMGGGWPTPVSPDENRRAEISVSASNPDQVLALLTGSVNGGNGLYGVYTSGDQGASWTFNCCGPYPGGLPDPNTNPPNINLMGWDDQGLDDGGQYYYDLGLAVSPFNSDSVFVAGIQMWVSGDGGSSFVCPAKWSHPYKPNYIHADIHDVHYYSNGEIWIACDGGIFMSNDNGASYERRMFGIEGSDFWGFGTDFWQGDVMIGGAYHNGTLLKNGNVYINGWNCIDGGDGTGGFGNAALRNRVYSNYNVKDLPNDRTTTIPTRNYAIKPFTHYIIGRSSKIEVHPNNYNIQYFGKGTHLFVTYDDHLTADTLYDFGEQVADIEVSLSDPGIMVVTTFPGYWNEKHIFRSTDGGLSWTDITPDQGVLPNKRWIAYDVDLHDVDTNVIYLARVAQSVTNYDGEKVFKSADGGTTWSNLTTSDLDGIQLTNLVYQRGTADGLYLGSRDAVFYRNSAMSSWMLFNNGLPTRTFSTKLIINYRSAAIRNGTNRSVYECSLYETSVPTAQIMVDKFSSGCLRDTFYFFDYSALHEENASWNWSFPGAAYVDDSTSRTPKVVYGSSGSHSVTLSVSNQYGSDTKTMDDFIHIDNQCTVDTIPGDLMRTYGDGDYVQLEDLDMTATNTVTMTAWIRPDGVQHNYSGIVMHDGSAAGLNFNGGNNSLAYHWPGGSWSWNSGLVVPAGAWSHVALVARPNSMTLYLNGVESAHETNLDAVDIGTMKIGSYKGWSGRNFIGEIDEVTIWNRSLTTDEIRKIMHITRDKQVNPLHATFDPSLVAYYQFNGTGNKEYDKAGAHHGIWVGDTERLTSNVPVGAGTASAQAVGEGGVYTFDDEGFEMYFSPDGSTPEGDVVVSRLHIAPDTIPGQGGDAEYWIIRNFGGNSSFDGLDSLRFFPREAVSSSCLSSALFKRSSNASGATWSSALVNAASCASGINGYISYDVDGLVQSFSQFYATQYRGNYYVDSLAENGDQSGKDWEHAFTTLQPALERVGLGDTIFVARGTYFPEKIPSACTGCVGVRRQSYDIPNGAVIIGGFNGFYYEARDDDADYETRFSGQLDSAGVQVHAYHVVFVDSFVESSFIHRITILDGKADGTGMEAQGSGIYTRGSLTLDQVRLTDNASTNGGCIHVSGNQGYLHLLKSEIFGNPSSNGVIFDHDTGAVILIDEITEIKP